MTDNDDVSVDKAEQPEVEDAAAGASAGDEGGADALLAAQAESEENLNKYIRLAAEMENLRKRTARDVEQARKFGIERFATELLAVCDGLEMGLEAGQTASVEALLEGKQATLKLLRSAMSKSGVELIDPEGEPFDPQLHEAMTMQPSASAEPGSVLTVVQSGYQLNGRLLRPARVIVAAEPPEPEPEPEPD
ncbi:MAG: nucleotide exchange factor GrpE [Gammaproteobacteria bacterium]|nr:MAG: nucleotide exchange factor GrpE [Gammaproteobacteria bacterium]